MFFVSTDSLLHRLYVCQISYRGVRVHILKYIPVRSPEILKFSENKYILVTLCSVTNDCITYCGVVHMRILEFSEILVRR